jgi:hypothetical protein
VNVRVGRRGEIALALHQGDALDAYEADRAGRGPPVPVTTGV